MTHFPIMTVLHTPEHRGLEELRQNVGLVAPFSVRSFTDAAPKWNDLNDPDTLRSAAYRADYLFIQEELIGPASEAARLAIGATLIRSDRLPTFMSFSQDNAVRQASHREVTRLYGVLLDELDEVSTDNNPMLEAIK